MLQLRSTVLLLIPILSCTGLRAEDWPQWRGPSQNGVSAETSLPTRWGVDENLAWKAPITGLGASSPITWGDFVFVTSQTGNARLRGGGSHPILARDDRNLGVHEDPIGGERMAASEGNDVDLVVEAFRKSDGTRVWEFRAPATGEIPELHEKHNLATPTPATDGERVYAWFGNGQIFALDMKGKLVWTRHLGEEFGPFQNNWGHGSSPALYKGLLVLLCDHVEKSYILAVDKATGKTRWMVDRGREKVSHATPKIVSGLDGDEMIVNSSERVDVFDPSTGELLWYTGSWRQTPIPTPVSHDGVIYMARGYRNSDVLALNSGARGEVSADDFVWRVPNGASYVPSILQYDGFIYMTNEIGIVKCVDATTGARVWQQRVGGIFFASPTAGDGKIYMASETGETFVLEAGRKPNILATNDLGERLIASPAISGGRLYLRSDRTLFAVGE